ncbi:MAG: ribosomal protein, partial [Patescibacteria group bacterium]|nr:ribosomal protein [Patescibacteria group bacterium]
MPRVKRGTAHIKKRKNLLKKTKGYMWGRSKKVKQAKEAIL